MLELKDHPEAHTLEASGTTGSAPGTQDRTEANGTGDVTRRSTDVRQARASRREGHKSHAKKGEERKKQESTCI